MGVQGAMGEGLKGPEANLVIIPGFLALCI